MASGPIISWDIDGVTVETVSDFFFFFWGGGSKITADGDCSHEIKRCLLLGREIMTNLDSVLKSRAITLPTTVHLVKAMVFPVVMYGYESWTMKKAECQSWVLIGRTEAETPILWTTSCEELTHWKRPWCWEGLGTGGEGDDRGWDGWMASPTRWTWVWVVSGSWWWTGRPGVLRFLGSQRIGHNWAIELNWESS